MPKSVEVQVYSFNELSDKAKEKAHYEFLSSGFDCGSIDLTREQSVLKLEHAGFTVNALDYSVGGQGDYASINGRYRYRKGWKKAYIAEYGNKCKILPYLLELQALQAKVFYDFDLLLTVTNYGTQLLDYDCIGDVYSYRYQPMPDDIERDMKQTILNINAVILADLKSDYDDACSEDYFADLCDCNEWTFLEDGELFNE